MSKFTEHLGIGDPKYINADYTRIDWDSYFMSMAQLASKRSHDSETQHGCVFVRNKRVIATGFNGYPPESPDNEIPNVRLDGKKYPFINHSEISAIFNAAKEGVSVDGCTAYITGLPCSGCARALVSVGIKKWVVGSVGYCSSDEDQLLREYWVDRFGVEIVYLENQNES